ncbi:DinB family protein [Kibdelosporangium philippinense]|uniref:DinB family protein n=1 Tax=Kibdelosporangium philippinense TaxID=211113 RepID=A0ABS8ZJM2_9PSEU|nr:DinB family protein [Kibdelosporangium philippinense]MCE7007971.1 DinB family protein [Kibdelosporangium philippinense]
MSWRAPEVTRPRPSLVADERANLLGFLEFHRATFLWKCSGLTGEQLALRAVPPSTLSLLGLVRHMVDVEHAWFVHQVGGQPVRFHFFHTEDIEFTEATADTAEYDYGLLIKSMEEARDVLDGVSLDHTFEHERHGTMNTRWVMTHMIEEYARHCGHADILREQIDGTTGE